MQFVAAIGAVDTIIANHRWCDGANSNARNQTVVDKQVNIGSILCGRNIFLTIHVKSNIQC